MGKNYSVKEIQEEMLVLLKMFHAFCMEHSVSYSIHGGTLLGAVREHGFIPWDDDADVSFTRRDFEKLDKLLIDPGMGDCFRYSKHDNAFPQLWMKREGKPAVWVDFFVYDYITESGIGRKLKFLKIAVLLGLLKNKETMYLTKKRGIYKGFKYALIYAGYLFGKTMSIEKKYVLADKIRMSSPGSRKFIHRANDRFISAKYVYPKELMEKYIMLKFEDTELMATADYELLLSNDYGNDYMTPVKVEGGEAEVHDEARDILPEFLEKNQ